MNKLQHIQALIRVADVLDEKNLVKEAELLTKVAQDLSDEMLVDPVDSNFESPVPETSPDIQSLLNEIDNLPTDDIGGIGGVLNSSL